MLVVAVWLALSIGSVVLAGVTWLRLARELEAEQRAVKIRTATERVLRLMVDCETGQRGFSLTGVELFLEPLQMGETNLLHELGGLVELTQGDATLQPRAQDMRAEILTALQRLHHIVEARRQRGERAAAAIVGDGQGKAMMDRIRFLAEDITRRLANSSGDGAASRTQLSRAIWSGFVAGACGLAAGLYALWLCHLTVRHQLREQQLIEARLQAERNSREKSAFLASMSHEIRTPMNAILGFSELLVGELQDPRHRQYLQSIRTSADSLLQMINDVLDIAKIEAGVLELRREPTNPKELCEFVHTMFAEACARKGVKLVCTEADDLPSALLVDRIRLRQILVNLVGNAVKFTDQGEIALRITWDKICRDNRLTLRIDVEDTGVGIPEAMLQDIFKPFVQAGVHRDREKQGSGLGLSIVRRLTEAMGGTVSVASLVGHGSVFHLCFPEVEISPGLPAARKLDNMLPADFNELRPATILAVDDNKANCQLIEGYLRDSHHRLILGGDGQEAVQKVRAHRPDVVLLDLRMPGLDGEQALASIRATIGMERLPVIAVTASGWTSEEDELRKRFSGYLRKPFSKGELFAELAHFLPKHTPSRHSEPAVPSLETVSTRPAPSAHSPEFHRRLRRHLQEDWPALRHSLAFNETKAFAARLTELAQQANCPPLLTYAHSVAQAAENYDVLSLEKRLADFGNLVEELDGKVSP